MTLQLESIPQEYPERRMGRLDRYHIQSFTEESDPALVERARQVHGEGYVNEGFVVREALTDEGFLPESIDKARGETVEYFLSNGWDVTDRNVLSTEQATMRKIGIPEGQTIDFLPAYQLCADNLDPEYREYLQGLPVEKVKEVAALARTENASPMAVFELLRDAVQDAQNKEEVWFFSIVSTTYQSLVENFGPDAIKQIGEPVSFDDNRIGEDITLVPAIVHTESFIEQLRKTAIESQDEKQQRLVTRSFMFFTEGLKPTEMSEESVEFRDFITSLMAKVS